MDQFQNWPTMADAKNVISLTFATARWRSSSTHCVSSSQCLFIRGDVPGQNLLKLLLEARFLAKNQLSLQAPEFITTPGITHLDPDEPERMLCPVRQVALYLWDTGCQGLFLHWDEDICDISQVHASRWLVQVVKEAYGRADLDIEHVTAHEVWAVSASWAYLNQIPLEHIISASFWRSQWVFQQHYLRDLAWTSGDMAMLGPIAAAQAEVHSRID